MNLKAILSAVFMSLVVSASFAESSSGTVETLHIHDHFTQFIIKGETAQKIYERLQVPEKEDVNGMGQNMGSLSKISEDGRMWCNKIPQGASGIDIIVICLQQNWLENEFVFKKDYNCSLDSSDTFFFSSFGTISSCLLRTVFSSANGTMVFWIDALLAFIAFTDINSSTFFQN